MIPNQPPTSPPGPPSQGPPTGYPAVQPLPPPGQAPVSYDWNNPGQPSQPTPDANGKVRPWWGLGDCLLALPFIFAFVIVGSIIAVLIAISTGEISFDPEDIDSLQDSLEAAPVIIVVATFFQQLGFFIWPFIVGRWKGFGAAQDFGFRFEASDIGWGIGGGVFALMAGAGIGVGLSWLLGVEDGDAENTQFLSDNLDSPWLIGLIFIVVIGAPFSEEILFRGLILRAFEKRAGWIAGLIGSSVLFTVIHVQPGMGWAELGVLFGVIGMAGTIFGAMAIKTGRIGGAIIAHMVFNGAAVASILATQ